MTRLAATAIAGFITGALAMTIALITGFTEGAREAHTALKETR